jgi:hypothetical protein
MTPTSHTSSGNVRARSIAHAKEHLAATVDLRAYVKQPHGNVRMSDSIAVRERFGKVFLKTEGYAGPISDAVRGPIGSHEGVDATAPRPERPPASPAMHRAAAEVRERIDVWVNEGGAGGELNR